MKYMIAVKYQQNINRVVSQDSYIDSLKHRIFALGQEMLITSISMTHAQLIPVTVDLDGIGFLCAPREYKKEVELVLYF